MQNTFLRKIEKIIEIKITGRNVTYYISHLYKKNISLFEVKIISRKEAYLKLYYQDYLNLKKEKTTYEISIYQKHGLLKFKDYLKKNMILFCFLLLALGVIYFLSLLIFDIEIITSNTKLKELVSIELKNHGIEKYQFKKSYDAIEEIIEEILNDNKDDLEWLEITNVGNKYVVSVQERKKAKEEEEYTYQHIIASKSGIIMDIDASSGEIIKSNLDYVNKGDIIISGSLLLPSNETALVKADGKVYAEVWYKVKTFMPYIYQEEIFTGNSKRVYIIEFLNKRISLLDYQKYNSYKSDNEVLLYHNLLPIRLVKEKQYEMHVIDEAYTKEEAITKARESSREKLLSHLEKDSTIKSEKVIKVEESDQGVNVEVFYSVIEQIGTPLKIENDLPDQEEEN